MGDVLSFCMIGWELDRNRRTTCGVADQAASDSQTNVQVDSEKSPVSLNVALRSVSVQGERISLTDAEFRILRRLLDAAPMPVDAATLASEALGTLQSIATSAVRFHILGLRRKLSPVLSIETMRGLGYRIDNAASV